jgi:site-specific DNA-methyltransferase (adenine-specific)
VDEYENRVLLGTCLDVLRELPDECLDACVTDPPYGLGTKEPTVKQLIAFLKGADLDTGGDFMGTDWEIPSVPVWREVYRVLKPGAHVLSFGGTRAWDLISMGLRAAGFEYRDTIADEYAALQWIHGQGMPKSLNVSKAIDEEAGAEREVIGTYRVGGNALTPTSEKGGTFVTGAPNSPPGDLEITAPATAEAKVWDGYGTGLKPAWEPILVFRKPLAGKVIDNVREHGTGAINIDATRVYTDWDEPDRPESWKRSGHTKKPEAKKIAAPPGQGITCHPKGRWPSNLVLAHAPGCKRVGSKKVKAIGGGPGGIPRTHGDAYAQDSYSRTKMQRSGVAYRGEQGLETVENWVCVEGCPVRELDEQSIEMGIHSAGNKRPTRVGDIGYHGGARGQTLNPDYHQDSGGASRFFPSFPGQEPVEVPFHYCAKPSKRETHLDGLVHNDHPTKKPLELMRWLVKLVCAKGGIVLDPYCGSGATLHAACEEEMLYIGVDKDPHAVEIATARMDIVSGREHERRDQMSAFDLAMGLDDDAD